MEVRLEKCEIDGNILKIDEQQRASDIHLFYFRAVKLQMMQLCKE